MENEYQPYAKVESLYGPGSVGAWLLTIVSVFISWTLNKQSRRQDTISIDFVAALTLPIVAAGHLFVQVARLPMTVAEAMTAEDIDTVQRTAAIEAPLNICETFSIVALALSPCCGPLFSSRTKWNRLGLTLAVGLLSWATEELLFERATRKGVRAADAMLSRSYVFLVTSFVGTVWAFLGICLVLALGFVSISLMNRRHLRLEYTSSGYIDRRTTVQASILADNNVLARLHFAKFAEQLRKEERLAEQETYMMRSITVATALFLPVTFVATLIGTSMISTKSQILNQNLGRLQTSTQPFFIPRSLVSLNNLDQALALSTGAIVVIYSVVAAWTSFNRVPAYD